MTDAPLRVCHVDPELGFSGGEVQVFLLEYSGDSDSWEERHLRQRRWCSYEDALRLIKKPQIRALLEDAQGRLSRMATENAN